MRSYGLSIRGFNSFTFSRFSFSNFNKQAEQQILSIGKDNKEKIKEIKNKQCVNLIIDDVRPESVYDSIECHSILEGRCEILYIYTGVSGVERWG